MEARGETGRTLQKTHDLKELVSRITPKNRHAASDTGPAVGNEVW
jgi:antitoxin component of MazEF toxin-antitoxin module